MLFSWFIPLLILGCGSRAESGTQLREGEWLVWIEGADGQDGFTAGRFGDLAAFSPESNEYVLLTDDGYFDTSPTFSHDRKWLAFASMRVPGTRQMGLGAPSRIYKIELSSLQIQQIDLDRFVFKNDHEKIFSLSFDYCAFARKSNDLAFSAGSYMVPGPGLYVYHEAEDSVSIIGGVTRFITDLEWSENDSLIAAQAGGDILLIDLVKGVVDTLSEAHTSYDLGDVKDDTLLFVTRSSTNIFSSIRTLSLKTRRVGTVMVDSSGRLLAHPVFGEGGMIYYLRSITPEEFRTLGQVCSFNRFTKQTRILREDSHEKMRLTILRRSGVVGR